MQKRAIGSTIRTEQKRTQERNESNDTLQLKGNSIHRPIGYLSPGAKEFDFAGAGFESFIDLHYAMHSYNDQVEIHKALGDDTGLDEIQLTQLDITEDGERTEKVIEYDWLGWRDKAVE